MSTTANDTAAGVPKKSNKFVWSTYTIPRPSWQTTSTTTTLDGDDAVTPTAHHSTPAGTTTALCETTETPTATNHHGGSVDLYAPHSLAQDDISTDDNNPTEMVQQQQQQQQQFVLRHLKQGATGAVKTWPAAEILLDYLVVRGGLLPMADRDETDEVLDLTTTAQPSAEKQPLPQPPKSSGRYTILELGAGTGFLGVGLALAMNQSPTSSSSSSSTTNNNVVRIMCTDHDKNSIKNMRYNVMEQPNHLGVHKAVRVESLAWDNTVGGTKLATAIQRFFGTKKAKKQQTSNNTVTTTTAAAAAADDKDTVPIIAEGELVYDDPICWLTHLIASDVHYGETTLDPLSDIIAAVKLRHPTLQVTLLLCDRTPGSVAKLQGAIESKLRKGLEELIDENTNKSHQSQHHQHQQQQQQLLDGFSVRVRDVVHEDMARLKLVEC